MASGQWRSSDRASRLPADWPKIRRRILKRDGYACRWIENGLPYISRATDVDHVIPNDDDSDQNLQSLCGYHHGIKSSREGGQAFAARQRRRFRTPEKHPGAL